MVGLRGVAIAGLQSCLGVALVLAMVGYVSANPIAVPPGSIATSAADGIYILFLTNLPIDILLFSLMFLLVFWKFKSPLRAKPRGANSLVASVVIAGVVITVTGALIDFYGLYTNEHVPNGFYVPAMTWENMAIAGAVIFISVFAVSLAIGMLRLLPAVIPAAAITAVNLIAWTVWEYPSSVDMADLGEWVVLLAGIVFLFVPPVIFGIVHLHGVKGVRT